MKDVQDKNQGIRAAMQSKDNANDLAREAELPFSTQVFANAQHSVDKKETSNTAFMGDETRAQSYAFGLSKATKIGLNAKVGYNVLATEIKGANPQFSPQGKQWEAHPSIELSQSLWRNAFGSETRAVYELTDAQGALGTASEEYKISMMLAEAEMTYWRLAAAREVRAAQEDNLKRAKRIYDWNKNRVNLSLADRTDLLQAEAALRFRELELTQARTEERAASLAFNRVRNSSEDVVKEALESISDAKIDSMEVPKRGERADVEATVASAKLSEIQAKLNAEKYTPTLELFGSYTMNGRDSKYGDANSEAFDADKPTTAIGIRLNASLNVAATHRQKAAARIQASSARMLAEQKKFEVDREWEDLVKRFGEMKERLRLARDIEKIQKDKLGWERDRQTKGRSTTFQVLQFEGDFTTSQLNRIQTEAELLRLYAQLKTFGASL